MEENFIFRSISWNKELRQLQGCFNILLVNYVFSSLFPIFVSKIVFEETKQNLNIRFFIYRKNMYVSKSTTKIRRISWVNTGIFWFQQNFNFRIEFLGSKHQFWRGCFLQHQEDLLFIFSLAWCIFGFEIVESQEI